MPAPSGFWLVQTGGGPGQPAGGASEVQQFPAGQKPPSAAWGGAVYLGSTVSDVRKWVGTAAARLGVPNPTNVPSLGTSLGIIGAIVAGFGGAASATAGGIGDLTSIEGRILSREPGASTEPEVKPNPDEQAPIRGRTRPGGEPATDPAAGIKAQSLASVGIAGTQLGFGSLTDFLNFFSWLFHPLNWLRVVEFLTGLLFIYFGLRASFRGFGRGSPPPRPFIRRTINRVVRRRIPGARYRNQDRVTETST